MTNERFSPAALPALVKEDRVHRDLFVDPQVFDLEMANIHHRTWVYVGHESEIRNPGDFKTTTVGTEPVILSRDKAGDLHVMVNACKHRGVTLCETASGNQKFFICAYHGWVFDGAGSLVNVPEVEGQPPQFSPAEFGLTKAPKVESYRGFIFASFNDDVPPLIDHLGEAAKFIAMFSDLSPSGSVDVSSGVTRYQYEGNWKQQVENSMDGYHAAITHHSFFDEVLQARIGRSMASIVSGTSPAKSVALGNGHSLIDFRDFDRKAILGADQPKSEVDWHSGVRANLEDQEYAEEVIRVNGGDGFNLLVYPNLVLINNQIRVIQPVANNHTEVLAYPALLEQVDEEINISRVRAHEDFYGPASFGAPDDIEMFKRQWDGLSRSPSMQWLLYDRGLHREQLGEGERRSSQVTDETAHRGVWRRWIELMTAEALT